jgi:hypothetical protein
MLTQAEVCATRYNASGYSLYEYKSTNTDAEFARAAWIPLLRSHVIKTLAPVLLNLLNLLAFRANKYKSTEVQKYKSTTNADAACQYPQQYKH